ncbi:hypothetical protein BH23BAC4_BH23BAC4_15100 [soil metagenome]
MDGVAPDVLPYTTPFTYCTRFRRSEGHGARFKYGTRKKGCATVLGCAAFKAVLAREKYYPIAASFSISAITTAKTSGATIVASDSIINLGVSAPSLPQVIFSFGTAPEYEP